LAAFPVGAVKVTFAEDTLARTAVAVMVGAAATVLVVVTGDAGPEPVAFVPIYDT